MKRDDRSFFPLLGWSDLGTFHPPESLKEDTEQAMTRQRDLNDAADDDDDYEAQDQE